MPIDLEHLEGRWQPVVGDEHVTEPLLFRDGAIFREQGDERVGRYGLFEDELFVQFRPAPNGDATLLLLRQHEIDGSDQFVGSEIIFSEGAAIMINAAFVRVSSTDAPAQSR